ncbi:MAG: molybdopterin molybdotransferase MoeA [Planctomycetes bacterium]|nr:molybdopterin molybdotransferase MoeA [Planctomycetota bacterium]
MTQPTPPAKSGLPSYDEALARVLEHVPALRVERVPLSGALGRVLREDVAADRDQPPFNRSAMDGFAVRSVDIRPDSALNITGTVSAGGATEMVTRPLAPGTARRIATGAALPIGADAVIQVELSTVEGDLVRFMLDGAKPWQNVHRRAADAAAGKVVLRAGTVLMPRHIGIAASVGAVELAVTERPRITLLTTGDEVLPAATTTANLAINQIRNSNGPMLTAILANWGTPALQHLHLPDDPEATRAAAREALAASHLVITNGGVSVGERDFIPAAWQHLGLQTVLHNVNIQPGRPVLVTRDDCKLVLGLPGNPVSVLCTAHLFARPVLRLMLGVAPAALPWRDVRLAEATKSNAKRLLFRAVQLHADGTATVIPWQGSGDLIHTADADGFVRLPQQDAPIAAGTSVPFLALGSL